MCWWYPPAPPPLPTSLSSALCTEQMARGSCEAARPKLIIKVRFEHVLILCCWAIYFCFSTPEFAGLPAYKSMLSVQQIWKWFLIRFQRYGLHSPYCIIFSWCLTTERGCSGMPLLGLYYGGRYWCCLACSSSWSGAWWAECIFPVF